METPNARRDTNGTRETILGAAAGCCFTVDSGAGRGAAATVGGNEVCDVSVAARTRGLAFGVWDTAVVALPRVCDMVVVLPGVWDTAVTFCVATRGLDWSLSAASTAEAGAFLPAS